MHITQASQPCHRRFGVCALRRRCRGAVARSFRRPGHQRRPWVSGSARSALRQIRRGDPAMASASSSVRCELATDGEASRVSRSQRSVAIAAEARQDMGARRLVRGVVALAVVVSEMVMVTGRAKPAVAVTPPTVTAQLVRTIPTSGFDPPSPIPRGSCTSLHPAPGRAGSRSPTPRSTRPPEPDTTG